MATWTPERREAASLKAKASRVAEVVEAQDVKMNYLHKVEAFNGEVVPEVEDNRTGMGNWSEQDKIDSITNTIKILPPNMIKDGRHVIENIQALNVFKITPELIDKAYANFAHDL